LLQGHSGALLIAYPQLALFEYPFRYLQHCVEIISKYSNSLFSISPVQSWGVFSYTVDPTSEQLYAFLEDVFQECSLLFPDSMVHIGGDEVSWPLLFK
jgi:hexosaminidase